MNSVPILSVACIAFSMLAGVAIPLLLYLFLRKQYGCARAPFWVGCAVMAVFALGLEQFAHYLILTSSLGAPIRANVWVSGLYGAFMAGLFEETGRYVAFRTVLRGARDNDHNALMYGAGHGGFEAFWLLVIGLFNTLLTAVVLNWGDASSLTAGLTGDALAAAQQSLAALSAMPPAMFLVAILERGAAIIAQISLSVLVWFAAKRGGKVFLLYPLAIALHMALDAMAVILNSYVSSVLWVELAVWIYAGLCALLARAVWKKQADPAAAPQEN